MFGGSSFGSSAGSSFGGSTQLSTPFGTQVQVGLSFGSTQASTTGPSFGTSADDQPSSPPNAEAAAFANASQVSGSFGGGWGAPATPPTTGFGGGFGGGFAAPSAATASSTGFGSNDHGNSINNRGFSFGTGITASVAPTTSSDSNSGSGFMFGGDTSAASVRSATAAPPGFANARMDPRDRVVPGAPSDTVTQLRFSPQSGPTSYLIASSWAKDVRFWEINENGNRIRSCAVLSHAAPVLSCSFASTADTVFTAGADRTCLMWSVATNTTTIVGTHDAPIKEVFYCSDANILITGGWDGFIRFWDVRAAIGKPQSVADIGSRVYSLDCRNHLMVAACGSAAPTSTGLTSSVDRNIFAFDLRRGAIPNKMTHPLRMQLRSVACFTTADGYVVGSVEGRCAVNNVPAGSNKDFAFKCHRDGNNSWAVNTVSFHPGHGTFATGGADGAVSFWDKDAKQRLKLFNKDTDGNPVTSGCFNADGSLYAYAHGYDWSKGGNPSKKFGKGSHIGLHACEDTETRPRSTNRGLR